MHFRGYFDDSLSVISISMRRSGSKDKLSLIRFRAASIDQLCKVEVEKDGRKTNI